MPEAAKNYSITELEMCGLAMNIATFSHLLKKVDFDAIVDHLAITHIMRSKAEPATTRIKRLPELLSPYSFNLYYIKGKDMVLSNFLSKQKTDDSNPHELIPILFMLKSQVDNHFYQIDNETSQPKNDRYLVQTRSQVKSSGIKLPEIHGANKGLDPHVQPGKQRLFPSLPIQTVDKGPSTYPIPQPRIGQGRARLRRKVKALQPISSSHQLPAHPITEHVLKTVMPLPEPTDQSQSCVQPQIMPRSLSQHQLADPTCIGPKIQHRPSPPYYYLYARPPPKPPDIIDPLDSQKDLLDYDLDRKVEIEENSPFKEGIISEIYERPDTSYVQEPQELKDLIDTTKLIQKFLPKQMDIDKILDIIKGKVLKGTHLPLTIKEIQAGYLSSPYFKDLYLFQSQNKLPSKRSAIKKVKTLAESFVLLDSLIFKWVMTPDKEAAAVLAIPEICIDKIIALYHTSLFTGHQGVVKTYLTMKDKFFIPNLMHYMRSFIKGCHICQLSRSDKLPTRQLQTQIYLNYRLMSKLSMDLKVMPRS